MIGSSGKNAASDKSLLTESAELHLLEATSHIVKPCAAQSITQKLSGKVWDETPILSGSAKEQEEQLQQLEQRQLVVLHELTSVLVKQIQALLAHTQIKQFGEDIAKRS